MLSLLPLLLAQVAAPVPPATQPDRQAPSEIVAAAPAAEWVTIAAEDLLVMELVPDAQRRPRRVVIQLMPAPFSAPWVGNIRRLATAHWWDGTSVNRVQDNYVVQWGDATEKKPLPSGLATGSEAAYTNPFAPGLIADRWESGRRLEAVSRFLLNEHLPRPVPGAPQLDDPYGKSYTFAGGFAIAMTTRRMEAPGVITITPDRLWPVHCYAMVGVGRNLSPDTGTGAELYTVIGHAPRHLDRNIALVGRVVEGIEHLSSLPRGTAALGFYATAAERTPIRSVRLASDLPAAQRPRLQYLSTTSASFVAYAEARANRRDAFFIQPAGGADVCNLPVPVRRAP